MQPPFSGWDHKITFSKSVAPDISASVAHMRDIRIPPQSAPHFSLSLPDPAGPSGLFSSTTHLASFCITFTATYLALSAPHSLLFPTQRQEPWNAIYMNRKELKDAIQCSASLFFCGHHIMINQCACVVCCHRM